MFKSEFLDEAIRIGNDILAKKIENSQGFRWKTISLNNEKKIKWQISESIYSGVGGIVLFFIELYKQTCDKKYLEAAIKGSDWLIEYVKKNPTSYYAFFTGRMGLTYVFSRMYLLTNEEKYLFEANKIAIRCNDFNNYPRKVEDLINGTSGTLLGLLLLHSQTKDNNLLPIINKFSQNLIESVQHGPKGLYWGKNTQQIRGLCGFSHGTAGVGYIFLLLGYYFKNSSFYWLAEQAFSYENHFFNENKLNWPDFRKGIYNKNDLIYHKKSYLKHNSDFFFKTGNMSAWCHGAPGIGLSRLHAWIVLKKEYLKKDIENSITCTKKETLSPLKKSDTFTLCHGKGGNAMFFIEAYKCFGNEEYKKWANNTALQAIEFRNKYNLYLPGLHSAPKTKKYEDNSLFLGNAGIGYFYLMCNDPKSTPSILIPNPKNKCTTDISSSDILNIKLPHLKKQILTKAYPRTLSIKNRNMHSFFTRNYPFSSDLKSNFDFYINKLYSSSKNSESHKILQILDLEKVKLDTEINTNSSFQYIKKLIFEESNEYLLNLNKEDLISTELVLNSDITFFTPLSEKNTNIIFLKTPLETLEFSISHLTKELLLQFKNGNSIKNIINDYSEYSEETINKIVFEQIMECIRGLFLIKKSI